MAGTKGAPVSTTPSALAPLGFIEMSGGRYIWARDLVAADGTTLCAAGTMAEQSLTALRKRLDEPAHRDEYEALQSALLTELRRAMNGDPDSDVGEAPIGRDGLIEWLTTNRPAEEGASSTTAAVRNEGRDQWIALTDRVKRTGLPEVFGH